MKRRARIAIILAIFLMSLSLAGSLAIQLLAQDPSIPVARGAHAMVYDPHNEQTVMFGGATYVGGFHYLSDTWVYSYTTNRWIQLNLNPSPSARSNHVMVYCNTTNEIILFGGQQGTGTWSFDCESLTWSQITTSIDPGVHHSLGMVYDPMENAVILFGGFDDEGFETDDTWRFDLETREWSELSPATSPLARYGHVMVYDESIKQVIMSCGNTAYQGHQDDTWAFNASVNTWTELSPSGDLDKLKWPSMTYDTVNQKAILFGGQIGDNPVAGTWIFDGSLNSWQKQYPDAAPSPRINTGLAFDSRNNVTVLFAGADFEFNSNAETWTYSFSDNNWTDMSEVPASPVPTPQGPPLEWITLGIAVPAAAIVIFLVWRRRPQ